MNRKIFRVGEQKAKQVSLIKGVTPGDGYTLSSVQAAQIGAEKLF